MDVTTRTQRVIHVLFRTFLVLALAVGGLLASPARPGAAGVGGPVILGGDDLTDHGSIDADGNPLRGWLYMQRALENIKPQVTRANNNSVAALGSAPTDTPVGGNAGSAIGVASAKAGMTVTYYDGVDAINGFFASLSAGTATPRIIWIAGTGARNDLEADEIAAINSNASAIARFVNSGGGLMSHGSAYDWLSTLLPGLVTVNGGSSGDLSLTAAGNAAFPGLTNAHVNAGPWHNYFEGNLGGLQILVTSGNVTDSSDSPAAVVIGGAAVVLPSGITLSPATATNPVGISHLVTATVKDKSGAPAVGVTVTFKVVSGPNAGQTGTATTNAAGQASFSYLGGGGPGTDTIEASFMDSSESILKDTATKTWIGTASPRLATVTATSTTCEQITASAAGLTPYLPYQIVVMPTSGAPLQIVDVTASSTGTASTTVDIKKAFGLSAGTFTAYVRLTTTVKYSKNADVTVAACPVATPAPTPTPTPTPAPVGNLPSTIGRLPSTSTDDGGLGAFLLIGVLVTCAISWRLRPGRT